MIYRTDKSKDEHNKVKHPYVEIDNRTIDSDLSNEALGLLVRMLRNVDDWDFSKQGMAKRTHTGRDKIGKLLNELKDKGYIPERTQKRKVDDSKNKGKFGKMEYTILEFPDDFNFDDDEPFGTF